MDKARAFFTKELTPEAVVKLYKRLRVELPGKVAVKVHSGEDGNQNYLRPEFMERVNSRHGTPYHRRRRSPRYRRLEL